jgi:hypothetical protein
MCWYKFWIVSVEKRAMSDDPNGARHGDVSYFDVSVVSATLTMLVMQDPIFGDKTECFKLTRLNAFSKLKTNCPVGLDWVFFSVLYLTFGKEWSALRTMIIT